MIYTLYTFNRWNILYEIRKPCSLDLFNSSCILIKGTWERSYTLFQVRWQSLWLSSVWAPRLGRGQSLCSRGPSQMGLGFCRGLIMWITVWTTFIHKLFKSYPHVNKLWITWSLKFCPKTRKLSTAYPHKKRRPASPSTPTMFEHVIIITRFG